MSTKGEMRVPKQTFLQYDCFGAYHHNIHTGEKENFWLFFHCHQWTFTRFGGWKVDFFPISTGFFCINSSLQKYASTGSKYLYGSQLVGWFPRLLSKAELLCVKGVNLRIFAIFKGFRHHKVVLRNTKGGRKPPRPCMFGLLRYLPRLLLTAGACDQHIGVF